MRTTDAGVLPSPHIPEAIDHCCSRCGREPGRVFACPNRDQGHCVFSLLERRHIDPVLLSVAPAIWAGLVIWQGPSFATWVSAVLKGDRSTRRLMRWAADDAADHRLGHARGAFGRFDWSDTGMTRLDRELPLLKRWLAEARAEFPELLSDIDSAVAGVMTSLRSSSD